MVKLLILADDFTGVLDTGVQFASQSIPTLVSTRIETLDQGREGEISVIALDLETRHLVPAQAADRVRQAVIKARCIGVEYFYKKTDSTLRGNIGGELDALMDANGGSIVAFVPAYPAAGRTTIAGRQYIDGIPLHSSAYAEDPLDPVRSSHIPEIIAEQSSASVEVIGSSDEAERFLIPRGGKRILVFDARREQDLRRIAEQLERLGLLRLTAGCAGFAAYLPDVLALKSRVVEKFKCPSQLLVVCGSTNPVSLDQVETAVQNGMERIVLEPEHLLGQSPPPTRIEEVVSDGGDLILQTAEGPEDIRRFHDYAREQDLQAETVTRLVAEGLSHLVGDLLRSRHGLTPVVFGGDTAFWIVESLGAPIILPIYHIAPGIVLSKLIGADSDLPLISKAGGYGASEVIRQIRDFVREN